MSNRTNKHFLLIYDYVPDHMEKRAPLRRAHVEHARASVARNELQLGGAVPDDHPPFAVQGRTGKIAEELLRADQSPLSLGIVLVTRLVIVGSV